MTHHISSDPSVPAQDIWVVIYKHIDGTNVTLYPSEKAANKGAGEIIVSYYEGSGLPRTFLNRVAIAINTQDWWEATRLFNSNNNISGEISVEKPPFMSDSEDEILTMTLESTEGNTEKSKENRQ